MWTLDLKKNLKLDLIGYTGSFFGVNYESETEIWKIFDDNMEVKLEFAESGWSGFN